MGRGSRGYRFRSGSLGAEAIAYLNRRLNGHGGIILLGPDGRYGIAYNTPRMAWGVATAAGFESGITRE